MTGDRRGFFLKQQSFWTSVRQSLSSFFSRDTVPPEYRELVRTDIARANRTRTLLAAAGLFLIELSNLFDSMMMNSYEGALRHFINTASIIGMALSLLTFVLLIVFINRSRDNIKLEERTVQLFWWIGWIFAATFLMINISGNGDMRNIFFIPLIYAVIPLFSWRQIVPMLVFFITSVVVMVLYFDKNQQFIQLSIVMSLLCLLVTQLLYTSQVRSYSFFHQSQDKTDQLDAMVRKLDELSKTDQLTRLPNRRALDAFLEVVWDHCYQHGVPMMVLILDIDFFKSYNDKFGHLCGDDSLIAIAQALRGASVGVTDYVGRFGGEEFMVISDHMSIEDTETFAEKLRTCVSDLKLETARKDVSEYVTISIGAHIEIPAPGRSIPDLIQAADKLLYTAKEAGRNRAVVDYEKSRL